MREGLTRGGKHNNNDRSSDDSDLPSDVWLAARAHRQWRQGLRGRTRAAPAGNADRDAFRDVSTDDTGGDAFGDVSTTGGGAYRHDTGGGVSRYGSRHNTGGGVSRYDTGGAVSRYGSGHNTGLGVSRYDTGGGALPDALRDAYRELAPELRQMELVRRDLARRLDQIGAASPISADHHPDQQAPNPRELPALPGAGIHI